MNLWTWDRIRQALRRQGAPAMRSRESFWAAFAARAGLMEREFQAPEATARWSPAVWQWSLAAAAVALVLLGWGVWFSATGRLSSATQVLSLDVVATHSGVVIIEDVRARGTIVWITDLRSEDQGAL